ncbi:unnamed protein product, partial [Ixodes persulcatus]
ARHSGDKTDDGPQRRLAHTDEKRSELGKGGRSVCAHGLKMVATGVTTTVMAVLALAAAILWRWDDLWWFSSNSGGHHKSGSNMVDQATLDKLDAGFKKLQDAKDCKSLLKKYLTKDVFEKLKTRKTAMGATLLDVIQS